LSSQLRYITTGQTAQDCADPAMLEVITLFIAGADGPRISQTRTEGMGCKRDVIKEMLFSEDVIWVFFWI